MTIRMGVEKTTTKLNEQHKAVLRTWNGTSVGHHCPQSANDIADRAGLEHTITYINIGQLDTMGYVHCPLHPDQMLMVELTELGRAWLELGQADE